MNLVNLFDDILINIAFKYLGKTNSLTLASICHRMRELFSQLIKKFDIIFTVNTNQMSEHSDSIKCIEKYNINSVKLFSSEPKCPNFEFFKNTIKNIKKLKLFNCIVTDSDLFLLSELDLISLSFQKIVIREPNKIIYSFPVKNLIEFISVDTNHSVYILKNILIHAPKLKYLTIDIFDIINCKYFTKLPNLEILTFGAFPRLINMNTIIENHKLKTICNINNSKVTTNTLIIKSNNFWRNNWFETDKQLLKFVSSKIQPHEIRVDLIYIGSDIIFTYMTFTFSLISILKFNFEIKYIYITNCLPLELNINNKILKILNTYRDDFHQLTIEYAGHNYKRMCDFTRINNKFQLVVL